MANLKTSTPSTAFNTQGGPAIDNIRRTFGIGDKVAELAPETSIFFSYLSKLGKKPIDETVWRPLEYRNQWQRRNFTATAVKVTDADNDWADATIVAGSNETSEGGADGDVATHIAFEVDYTHQGKVVKGLTSLGTNTTGMFSPIFLTKNQVVRVGGVAYKITAEPVILKHDGTNWDADTSGDKGKAQGGLAIIPAANFIKISDNDSVTWGQTNSAFAKAGQVMGSQWGEATEAPEGFRDEISSAEFYTQIFKTAVPLMSGSMMATKYRGYANEWQRIYAEHIKAHKMDLENAFLFGYGKYNTADVRSSWGIIPFLEAKGGKRYELDYNKGTAAASSDSTYDVKAGFNYDGIVDVMDDFMSYESGNSGQKLCLTSRKVINSLLKMGDGNFLSNSFTKASDGTATNNKDVFAATLDVKGSSFMPIDIASIKTSYGAMNFVAHPLFRNDMADKAVCIDLSNVSYRPLAGNGISRDTFVETNVQDNDIDGRKDMIITEAGLEVMLPETHAVIDFVE